MVQGIYSYIVHSSPTMYSYDVHRTSYLRTPVCTCVCVCVCTYTSYTVHTSMYLYKLDTHSSYTHAHTSTAQHSKHTTVHHTTVHHTTPHDSSTAPAHTHFTLTPGRAAHAATNHFACGLLCVQVLGRDEHPPGAAFSAWCTPAACTSCSRRQQPFDYY